MEDDPDHDNDPDYDPPKDDYPNDYEENDPEWNDGTGKLLSKFNNEFLDPVRLLQRDT